MSAAPRLASPAGHSLARERLAAYQRYAEVLTEQEAALDRGDMEAFEVLARAAQEIQAGLGESRPVRDLTEDPEAVSEGFVDRAAEILLTTMRRNERIRMRLHELRSQTGNEIRRASEDRPRLRRYLEAAVDARPRFDRRF